MGDSFQELLDALTDQTISDEQFARLEQLINEDAELRKRFLDYQHLCAELEERAIREDNSHVVMNIDSVPGDACSQRRSAPQNALTMAAVLLVGLMLGGPIGWMLNQQAVVEDKSGITANEDFVAMLSFVSDDIVWSASHGSVRSPGERFAKGWVRLDAGEIELKFVSNATVRIHGPAAFGIDSPLRGFLDYGSVSVYAPEEARDFVVGSAAMDVVDLGTRFNMTIDNESGEAEVEVVEGLVDLHLDGEGTSNRIESLPAGRSAVVNAEGEIVRIEGKAIDPKHQDTTGLLAHWKLDEVGEDGHVADASGNELHGTLDRITRDRSLSGRVGRALDLEDGGHVDLSEHITAITNTPAFTLSAWVRDARDIVFSVSNGTPRDRIQFELQGRWLYYGWQDGDRFDFVPARVSEWKRGHWYHLAVSVSGGNVVIYRDGQALIRPRSHGEVIGTRVRAPIDIDRPTHAYLGLLIANHARHKQYLGGQIDDVQYYGRALDEQGVRFLYEHPGKTIFDRTPHSSQN